MGKTTRLIVISVAILVVAGIALYKFYPKLNTPSTLKANALTTVTVERGNVISSIHATGIVESENEVRILSPARSIVKEVYKEPGSWVEKGELIIQLDPENVKRDIERLTDQLKMRRNSLEKTRLNAQSARLDLSYNEDVKKLRITSLKSTLADQEQLLSVGGISPARIEKTRQEITLAEKDLKTLKQKNSIRLKQLETDEKGLILQINVQEKSLKEKTDLLSKLAIKAPSSGIILAVSGTKGLRVEGDKTLVRMSDLSSFKVLGSIDEKFAKDIKTGNRVIVIIDDEKLEGRIGNITPLVENKKVQFNIHLKEKSHPKLIANQNVAIQIINGKSENVLRIKKLPAFDNAKQHDLFVLKGSTAVRTKLLLGTIGNEWCEIVSGAKEGERVITNALNVPKNVATIDIE